MEIIRLPASRTIMHARHVHPMIWIKRVEQAPAVAHSGRG